MVANDSTGVSMDYGQMDENIRLFSDAITDCQQQHARVEAEIERIRTGFYGQAGTEYQTAVNAWTEDYNYLIAELSFMRDHVAEGKDLTMRAEATNSAIVQGLSGSTYS
jgi:WXG100 family type VII secretion target